MASAGLSFNSEADSLFAPIGKPVQVSHNQNANSGDKWQGEMSEIDGNSTIIASPAIGRPRDPQLNGLVVDTGASKASAALRALKENKKDTSLDMDGRQGFNMISPQARPAQEVMNAPLRLSNA